MGKHDDTRVDGLAEFRRDYIDDRPDGPNRQVVEVEVKPGELSPMIVVTCGKWTAVINPQDIGGKYLDVDIHAFSGDAAHKARVVGFPYGGSFPLPGGHEYPLTAVIIGEDDLTEAPTWPVCPCGTRAGCTRCRPDED